MARISLAIGLADNKADTAPTLVYLGRDAGAMQRAIAASTAPRLLVVSHVQGIPKNNPAAAANAQRAHAAGHAHASGLQAKLSQLELENEQLRAEHVKIVERLESNGAAHRQDLESLNAQLAEAKTKADAQARTIAAQAAELEQLKAPRIEIQPPPPPADSAQTVKVDAPPAPAAKPAPAKKA